MQNPFELLEQRLSNIEQLLLDIKHGCYQAQSKPNKEKLSIEEISDYTGIKLNTLRGMVSRGEIPCSKPGKRLIFDRKKIDQWLYDKRKKTAAEIAEEVEDFLSHKK